MILENVCINFRLGKLTETTNITALQVTRKYLCPSMQNRRQTIDAIQATSLWKRKLGDYDYISNPTLLCQLELLSHPYL